MSAFAGCLTSQISAHTAKKAKFAAFKSTGQLGPSTSTNLSSSHSTFRGDAQQLRAAAPLTTARPDNSNAVCAASTEKMTIAITGATGLVGSRLVSRLVSEGHRVKVLTRNVNDARKKLPSYPDLQFVGPVQWASAIPGCDGVVNLAGEPIATRWTPELKNEILRSRVNVTSRIADAINACPEETRPKVLVSASAVGFYGVSDTQTFNEGSQPGQDFLSTICRNWEAAAKQANTRVVVIRNGIVLAKEGGAVGKMLPVFTIFAGGPLGSGKQWCSWVHRDDVVSMIREALVNQKWEGVYNAVAPNPVRMGELCSTLGSIMGRPSWLPVPDFALLAVLGEGASVVLEGQRVVPARAQDEGFQFKYTNVGQALRSIMRGT